MANKQLGILEVYCEEPITISTIISQKNPLGFKGKMPVNGSGVISIAEHGKQTKYVGARTIKVIPVNKKPMEGFKETQHSKKRKK